MTHYVSIFNKDRSQNFAKQALLYVNVYETIASSESQRSQLLTCNIESTKPAKSQKHNFQQHFTNKNSIKL